MQERSRIRFNPVTKEIELEGSEAFVKTYFEKLQKLMALPPAEKSEIPPQTKVRPVGRNRAGATSDKKASKETHLDMVVTLIRGSEEGITTSALKEKTGLSERQIWSIVYRAEKQGKIRKTKRGLYVAAQAV
jgi:uncharacterized membrane protein